MSLNKGTVETLKVTFEEVKRDVEAVLVCLEDIAHREELLERSGDILTQRENGLAKREAKVAFDLDTTKKSGDFIAKQIQENQDQKKKLEVEEQRIEGLRATLRDAAKVVETKIQALSQLEEMKKDLDGREAVLVDKTQEISRREALLQKEVIIDRERKEALSVRENEVIKEKERIKKYLNI